MNNVYEGNKCTDLQVEFKDIHDKVYQLIAARSTPAHFSHTYTPHKPCSYCSNPYHYYSNYPSWGQPSNFSYEQEWQYQNEHVKSIFASLELVVQHFPTTHIDDIGKRFAQFKEARVAHMQLPHTHPLYKRCSYFILL